MSYRAIYPSVVESEARMLDDLTAWLGCHGLTEALCQHVRLAVSEAFTNALTHANKYDPSKKISISLSINESAVSADIIDEGRGGLAQIRNHQPPGDLADHGRGLELIRHYASTVALSETGDGGVHMTIVFAREEEKRSELIN